MTFLSLAMQHVRRNAAQPMMPTWLENAYDASLARHVSREQFQAAQAALTVDLRQFPRLQKLARHEPKLAQALILLHAYAKGEKRKNSSMDAYLHSCEVAEETLRYANGCIPKHRILRTALKAVLHDGIEDFNMPRSVIQDLFGAYLAQRTQWVSAPSTAELAVEFPKVANTYIVLGDKPDLQPIEKHFSYIKREHRGAYDALKAALKTAHKCKIARSYKLYRLNGVGVSRPLTNGYRFDEVFFRGIDNALALVADTRDIKLGNLVVERDVTRDRDARMPNEPRRLFIDTAQANISNRSQCNDAILDQIQLFQKIAAERKLSRRTQNRLKKTEHFIRDYFEKAKSDLERAIAHPVSKASLTETLMMMAL